MTSVPVFAVISQARDLATGELTPPSAGSVPVADGTGGATWASAAQGGALRWFDAAVTQTLYDDGETKFVWDSVNRQPAFASAGPLWFGADGYFSEINHVYENDGFGFQFQVLFTQNLSEANFYILTGTTAPGTLMSYSGAVLRWTMWPNTAGSPVYSGVLKFSADTPASCTITRQTPIGPS
jgi:hypothetical protein